MTDEQVDLRAKELVDIICEEGQGVGTGTPTDLLTRLDTVDPLRQIWPEVIETLERLVNPMDHSILAYAEAVEDGRKLLSRTYKIFLKEGKGTMARNKKKVLKIIRPGFGSYLESDIETAIEELRLTLTEGGRGDTIVFELVEMTQEEYDALPEFLGW